MIYGAESDVSQKPAYGRRVPSPLNYTATAIWQIAMPVEGAVHCIKNGPKDTRVSRENRQRNLRGPMRWNETTPGPTFADVANRNFDWALEAVGHGDPPSDHPDEPPLGVGRSLDIVLRQS